MEARHWLGMGLLALCLGTGFSDVNTNSTFAIIAVLTLGISLLLPHRWLWIAYAFWAGILVTFGVFIWMTGAPDLKLTSILFVGGSVGLVYFALKSLKEVELLAKLTVWVPRSRPTIATVCGAACQSVRRGWAHSLAWTNATVQFERANLTRMVNRRGA